MQEKTLKTMLLLILLMASFVALTARNGASYIRNGRHDLSNCDTFDCGPTALTRFDANETCVFCHTPHGANKDQTYIVNGTSSNPFTSWGTNPSNALNGVWLWNRRLPQGTFAVYDSSVSSTLNATVGQPGLVSLLCLSCHDGVGAINVLMNYPQYNAGYSESTGLSFFGGNTANQLGDYKTTLDPQYYLSIGDGRCQEPGTGENCTGGLNLQNDHPIGFSYEQAQSADTGLIAFNNLPAILQKRLALRMVGSDHYVECSTCHDPHMTNESAVGNMFLVIDNSEGSALCFGCHNK